LEFFTHEITLNDEYLSQFLPDSKFLLMTLKQLLEIFVKLPGFIAAKQHAYRSRGKISFWPQLCEEMPEKPQKFHRNPIHGRIESIKSAGKRPWKVTLETCPGVFLETFIFCHSGFLICHLTGTSIGTSIDMDHILSRITL